MTGMPITSVEMDANETITVPTLLMVDAEVSPNTPVTWSNVCGGPATISMVNSPSYVARS